MDAGPQPQGAPGCQEQHESEQRHLAGRHGGGGGRQEAATTLLSASRKFDRVALAFSNGSCRFKLPWGRADQCGELAWQGATRFFELRLLDRLNFPETLARAREMAVPRHLPTLTGTADSGTVLLPGPLPIASSQQGYSGHSSRLVTGWGASWHLLGPLEPPFPCACPGVVCLAATCRGCIVLQRRSTCQTPLTLTPKRQLRVGKKAELEGAWMGTRGNGQGEWVGTCRLGRPGHDVLNPWYGVAAGTGPECACTRAATQSPSQSRPSL